MPEKLVEIRNLRTWFHTEAGTARAVDDVSLDIFEGEVLGLVGESGSGKSVTALSVLRLIPDPPGKIVSGSILYRGTDLLSVSWPEMRAIRGNEISMIFQEPMTSLNPVFTIGMQMTEIVLTHQSCSRQEALDRSVEMLRLVGIPSPKRRMNDYPHHFSGGMRQRVMIAMALACNPSLLIADEPTTALDVTIQAQILELMLRIKDERKGAAILLITHNLGVVAETCDRVAVMYGGKLQEVGPVEAIFEDPRHPYTQGLLASLPTASGGKHDRLRTIPGNVPGIHDLPAGCKFLTRCPHRFDRCDVEPELLEITPGRAVRCYLDSARSPGASFPGAGT